MKDWKDFVEIWDIVLKNGKSSENNRFMEVYGVYGTSFNHSEEFRCFMARDKREKFLIVSGGSVFDLFEGDKFNISGNIVKKCPLSNHNSSLIRNIFPYTEPVTVGENPASIGLGDRLGLASAGHLRLIKGKAVFPVLAQQSIRELNLTGRTYDDVLAAAVWAVFQEGYKKGYGADGDHLKTEEEVRMALKCGFTMITLDCSEYIDNSIEGLSPEELMDQYELIDESVMAYWERKYLNRTLKFGDYELSINIRELASAVLIYSDAIDFAESIYKTAIRDYDRAVDFEISIDETLTPTSVKAHYIIAAELQGGGVKIKNMAPRFCGEFQKGIDYKGDTGQFANEFELHSKIAEYFGYRISVHSGSDKFSVFPIIGDKTHGSVHLKTAGTNWLEALRVVALENPGLFRRMYKYAIKRLPDAKKFYHIFTEREMVQNIEKYSDGNLPELLEKEESRQALHITYGYLLCDKDSGGRYIFREEFFATLHTYEETYYDFLKKHIGRHLDLLGI